MAERSESSNSKCSNDDSSQGLDSLSLGNCENEEVNNEEQGAQGPEYNHNIDSIGDFGAIMFQLLNTNEIWEFKFSSLDIAYQFFNEYAKHRGFSLRKHKTGRNTKKDILWKSFVCSRQGARDDKFINNPNRKREARSNTRCDCLAEYQVHVVQGSSRWYVSNLNDEHNHELLTDKFVGRLPSHRRMPNAVVAEMNSMLNIGISTPTIFGSFAELSGGYCNVGFNKKKMYNELAKERKQRNGDAKATLDHLRHMSLSDPNMYWKHEVDDEGKLRHLFWCDGDSIVDYAVFGEVLAFDATYGRNKYKCPVVVFSGVNHHRQTVVFACAVVSDETVDTYTWMLEQLLLAMEGKPPKAVITDGDKAMRNAIARVFPNAHHRLCGWHLMRNCKTNVKKSKFLYCFKKCMFGDYEIEGFEERWKSYIDLHNVANIPWVKDVYAKKTMWAAAHMRGMFFAGLRTTSRCEGLHTQMGKYVGSKDNLYDFLKHFQRCLDNMRNNEIEADLESIKGDPIMVTRVPTLEMSGAKIYTRAVFFQYRDELEDLACVKVVGSKKTVGSVIYTVRKYTTYQGKSEWYVSYYEHFLEWRCSCKGMETLGIPCVHILAVVVELGIHELPNSLVCRRWCKNAKEGLEQRDHMGNTSNVGNRCTRFAALQHYCRRLCSVASTSLEEFNEVRDKINSEIEYRLSKRATAGPSGSVAPVDGEHNIRDPVRVTTKGCGNKSKKPQRCTMCKKVGHNKRKCPELQLNESIDNMLLSDSDFEDDDYFLSDELNVSDC